MPASSDEREEPLGPHVPLSASTTLAGHRKAELFDIFWSLTKRRSFFLEEVLKLNPVLDRNSGKLIDIIVYRLPKPSALI